MGLKVLKYRLAPRVETGPELYWEEGKGALQNQCPIWGLAGREAAVGAGMDIAIRNRDG